MPSHQGINKFIKINILNELENFICMQALVFHLERDPHPEVRRAVLKALGCNYFTLEFVLERLRDVKDLVRRQAYIFISER